MPDSQLMTPSRRRFVILPALAALAALAACGRSGPPRWIVSAAPDTVLSAGRDSLVHPAAMALAADATLYVLDPVGAAVVARRPGGGITRFGRKGEGPGELRSPSAIGVAGDTVWVLNQGNGRMELYRADGALLAGLSLPPVALSGFVAVARDGRLAAATMGVRESALALVYQPGSDQLLQRIGTPVVPPAPNWNLTDIRNATAAGTIPPLFRNFALPVFDPAGQLWLVLQGDGLVQRYHRDGRLAWSLPLALPEVDRIRQDYFEASRSARSDDGFLMLITVSDAAPVGEALWLLLRMPDEEPSVLVVVGRDGALLGRMTLSQVRGARGFEVDLPNQWLYLAVPSEGLVLRLPLPAAPDSTT